MSGQEMKKERNLTGQGMAERKTAVTWGIFSAYRGELMGFSILYIMLFHLCENFELLLGRAPAVLQPMIRTGSSGVEMFLFLSGIGLYYSYSKDPDTLRFWKKRLKAILIPYVILALPYLLWQDFIYTKDGIGWFLKDFFMLTSFAQRNRQCWYVALILLLYFAFPLFYRIMEKFGTWGAAALITVSAALPYLIEVCAPSVFNSGQVGFSRIPTFLFGIYAGRLVKEDRKMTAAAPAGLFTVLFVFNEIRYYRGLAELRTTLCTRYYNAAVGLLVLFLAAALLAKFRPAKLGGILAFCGGMTLELYLSHVELRRVFARSFDTWTFAGAAASYAVIAVLSFAVSIAVRKLSRRLSRRI